MAKTIEEPQQAAIAESLRGALRGLVRPVAVVTAEHEGKYHAMAATAFCEVSMDPPSMLVCVNRANATWKAIALGADIGINLLSESQAEVCRHCGGGATADTKFDVGEWLLEPGRPPRLADSCAAMVLRPTQLIEQGTHMVVIGEIVDIAHQSHLAPLAFHAGGYVLPLASAALNLMAKGGGTPDSTGSAHDFLVMRLMSAFYWFDEGMQTALQQRGWAGIPRAQSMAFANLAMGVRHPAGLARNLGISPQAIDELLAEMQQAGLVVIERDPDDKEERIVGFSDEALRLREDAIRVLMQLELIVGQRIGPDALRKLRDILSKDWGEVPELGGSGSALSATG